MRRMLLVLLMTTALVSSCDERDATSVAAATEDQVMKVFFANPKLVTIVRNETDKIGTFRIGETCGEPPIGEAAVYAVGWTRHEVLLIYGKSCVATVNLESKQMRCGGCD